MDGRVCIFGEVLFDHFPDGRRVLGGAPFNVAWHLQAFGQTPLMVSRVGEDPEGQAIREAMHGWGMELSGVRTDEELPTGRVSVDLLDGEPAYDIVNPAAYDAIEVPEFLPPCRLLYHGSLALRDGVSRSALEQIRVARPGGVFLDVNLRAPWWRRVQVLQWLQAADWVKLNQDELELLAPSASNDTAGVARFLAEHALQGLVLTRGAWGAELLTAGGERFCVRPDRNIEIMDTVGAGDGFSSVMILGLIHDWPYEISLQRAQDFASALVGRRGATVQDLEFYGRFSDDWKLNS